MVDIVDDDELGLQLLDKCLDVAVERIKVLPLRAENVEADEVEALLVGNVALEFLEDFGTDVRPVDRVDPEDFAVVVVCRIWAGEQLCGKELGEMVRVACFPAGEVGDVVLPDERLAINGD